MEWTRKKCDWLYRVTNGEVDSGRSTSILVGFSFYFANFTHTQRETSMERLTGDIHRIGHVESAMCLFQYNYRHSKVDEGKNESIDKNESSAGHLQKKNLALVRCITRWCIGFGYASSSVQIVVQADLGDGEHEC